MRGCPRRTVAIEAEVYANGPYTEKPRLPAPSLLLVLRLSLFRFRLLLCAPAAVAAAFVPLQLPAHDVQRRFRDGDFVRQNFSGNLVSFRTEVGMLLHQIPQIIGRLGVKPPERIAGRAGFDHDALQSTTFSRTLFPAPAPVRRRTSGTAPLRGPSVFLFPAPAPVPSLPQRLPAGAQPGAPYVTVPSSSSAPAPVRQRTTRRPNWSFLFPTQPLSASAQLPSRLIGCLDAAT